MWLGIEAIAHPRFRNDVDRRSRIGFDLFSQVSDKDAKVFVLFGDLKKSSLLGYKGSISVDRFNAGIVRNVADNADINLITTDREAIRWIERVGAIALLPTAVTRLKTAAA